MKGIHFKKKLRLQTSWRYANLQCQFFSKLFGLVKIRIKIQDSWVAWSIHAFCVVELWLKMRTLFGEKWSTCSWNFGKFHSILIFPPYKPSYELTFLPLQIYLYMLANLHFLWNLSTIIFLSLPLIFLSLLEMGEQFSFSLLILLSFGMDNFFLFPLHPFLWFLMSEQFFSFFPPPTCSFRMGGSELPNLPLVWNTEQFFFSSNLLSFSLRACLLNTTKHQMLLLQNSTFYMHLNTCSWFA